MSNLIVDYFKQTFLKTSRVHLILPKHSNATSFWAMTMMIGSIRCISIGNEYQLICSMVRFVLSNSSPNLWPSSQQMNTATNPKIPFKIGNNRAIMSVWCIWNRCWWKKLYSKRSDKSQVLTQLFLLGWLIRPRIRLRYSMWINP